MANFSIHNKISGEYLGTYDATDVRHAILAMALAAGYSTIEEMIKVAGDDDDLLITEVM